MKKLIDHTIDQKMVDEFLCDENYLALVESAREQRLLFITDMSETRVSAFLGWMFRPYEGHGLGDQALRELLHNAWLQVNSGEWEGGDAREMGFDNWTPSKIAHKSFRDLCVETEYRFGKSGKDSSKNRPVDVALISRANRLLILIENKFGSTVHGEQLKAYREQASESYPDYSIFRIYLDPNDENKPDDGNYWINLRYDWLIELIKVKQQSDLISERALNALSQVKDYLEQESDSEGAIERQSQIASLVSGHEAILKEMRNLKRLGPHGRLTSAFDRASDFAETLLIEYHQRKSLWNEVFGQMAHVQLLEPISKALGKDIEIRRLTKRLLFRKPQWAKIRDQGANADAVWGIRLAAWKTSEDSNEYNLRSVIDFGFIVSSDRKKEVPAYTPAQELALRSVAAKLRQLKKKSSADDRWIRLMDKKNLSLSETVVSLVSEVNRIDQALRDSGLQ